MATRAEELRGGENPDKAIHLKRFMEAPVGGTLIVPLGVLSPTTPDTYTTSHTSGPLDAYLLRETRTGETELWIADINTRYHTALPERTERGFRKWG